jgi:hypothetical protein
MKLTPARAWNKFRNEILGDASNEEVRSAKLIFYTGLSAGIAVAAKPGFNTIKALEEICEEVIVDTKKPKVTIQ